MDFYYVMLTLTVMAGLVTPPEDGVIVTVDVLVFGRFPVQPATTMNTSIAPTIPMRPRNRRVEENMNSRTIASVTREICRSVAAGGTFMDCGATMNEEAVSVAVAVAPGAAAAFVVGTAHEVMSVAGVQVKDTAPVNPPNPVMVTGNVPMAPLATLTLDGAETEKSQAVPVSGTDCGLPFASSVSVSVPVTGPAPVVGANVTLTVQLALAARVVPQVVVLPKPLDVLGTAVKVNVALPPLVRVTVCAALVVVSN